MLIEDYRDSPFDSEAPDFIVLGPRDETFLYRWGHHNIHPWADVIGRMHQLAEAGGFQQGPTDISLHPKGVLIDAGPDTSKWGRKRSQYSLDVKAMVRELLRRGLVKPDASVLLGNWASREGRRIGTAQQIAGRPDLPSSLVLYHGTSNWHFEEGLGGYSIREHGLRPMPSVHRVWRGERGHPAHREEAVYLTASLDTAEYYAKKAVRVLRARGFRGAKPVILQVRLTKREFPALRADDDYLARAQWAGKPASTSDWFGSLQIFGQVAFVGVIPPEQIVLM